MLNTKPNSLKRKVNRREIKVWYLPSQKLYEEKLVEINNTGKVLYSGPLISMLPCWRNALLLVRRNPNYKISKASRISLRNLQDNTRDVKAINDLELGQGIKFIIIELCFEK